MLPLVPNNDLRPLLYFFSIGTVAAATIGVCFGAGFLELAPPYPAAPSADSAPLAQAMPAYQAAPLADNHTAWGSLPGVPADKITASSTPGAPSNREAVVLRSTAVEATLIAPAGITNAKRIGVSRHRQRGTGRHWAAIWRPHASAGLIKSRQRLLRRPESGRRLLRCSQHQYRTHKPLTERGQTPSLWHRFGNANSYDLLS